MSEGPNLAALLDALDDARGGLPGRTAPWRRWRSALPTSRRQISTSFRRRTRPIWSASLPRWTPSARRPDPRTASGGPMKRANENGSRTGVLRPVRPLDPDDATTFDQSFESPHGRLDVVPEVAGTYEALRPRAARVRVAGADRWVASALDLLAGMTRPRRPKDGPRVRHLRSLAAAGSARSGVGFVGLRTNRFDEMVALFRDDIGLEAIREAPGATWFRLGSDAELHVYADTDPDHAFFTTGPVVGLRVDDVDATRARAGGAWPGADHRGRAHARRGVVPRPCARRHGDRDHRPGKGLGRALVAARNRRQVRPDRCDEVG